MNPSSDSIAIRLKKARGWAGLSQAQVAEILKIRRPSISEMESGDRKVSADELDQLCRLYNVSTEWILTGKENHDVDERVKVVARALAELKPEDLEKISEVVKALKSK